MHFDSVLSGVFGVDGMDPNDPDKDITNMRVEVDTEGMEHKTWSGTIKVTSNGGNKDVKVTLRVPRVKPRLLLFNSLLELLQSKFPLLFKLLSYLQ